jgi:hypothetical protein
VTLTEKALQLYPETRSDDKKLILAVWWLQDHDYELNFRKFFQYKAISPETIRRTRQKLQEQGLYPATEEVEEMRYNLFKNARYSRGATVAEEVR